MRSSASSSLSGLLFGVLIRHAHAAVFTESRGSSCPPNTPTGYDMPLTWTPFGFMTDVDMGTPAQTLPYFVDWTWISHYSLTNTCYGEEGDPPICLAPNQEHFKQAESSTFEYQMEDYPSRTWNPNHFFFYLDLTVDYASDIMTIGPAVSEVVFQAADMVFDISESPYPFAGVFGMSPVFKGDNASFQSPFYQQWESSAWESPLTAFHYCYPGSPDVDKTTCGGHDGLQTLGGIDPARVKNDRIFWYRNQVFPDVNALDFEYDPPIYNYWALQLTTLRIGEEYQPVEATSAESPPGAIFDHASYGRGMPLSPNAYKRLVEITGATLVELSEDDTPNNGEQEFFEFPCERMAELPEVGYRFKGHRKEWIMEPLHYVETLPSGSCVLNVRTLATGDMFIGNFGETFAKEKYIIFDFEKLKVGIAEVEW